MGSNAAVVVTLAVGLCGLAVPACAASSVACDSGRDATAMLNRAVAAGGQVRIGPGTCLLSGALVLPSNVTLTGSGIGVTVLKAAQGDVFNVIDVGGPREPGYNKGGSSNVDVSALTVDGSATQADTIGHHSDGILVRSASSGVRLHDLEVHGAGDNGIDVIGSHVDISDNQVHDNFHNGIYVKGIGRPGGIHVRRASFVNILRNTVRHNSLGRAPGSRRAGLGTAWDGIDIDPVTANCLVEGNTVDGNDIILLEHGKIVPSSGPHRIIGNVVMNSHQSGIDVAGLIDGFEVTGNRIQNVSVFGIVVGGDARNGVIRGNTITGTTGVGIMVRNNKAQAAAPQDIEISGNHVWPGPAAGGAPAIAVSGSTGVRVIGNTTDAPQGQAGAPAGLNLRRAGAGLVVQDNH